MNTNRRMSLLTARFSLAWHALVPLDTPTPDVDALLARWREPWRHYHGEAHLAHCLTLLDAHVALVPRPALVELALWFHDAIYNPSAPDNEARSAALALDTLSAHGLPIADCARIHTLILATRTHESDNVPDTNLLLDIDLAVLGAPPDEYLAYSTAIRREFAHVDDAAYATGRARVLKAFLARPAIYRTAPFFNSLEATARRNLTSELERR